MLELLKLLKRWKKKVYKCFCKEIELMKKNYTISNELSFEHEQLLKTYNDLCEENKGLKQNLEIQKKKSRKG